MVDAGAFSADSKPGAAGALLSARKALSRTHSGRIGALPAEEQGPCRFYPRVGSTGPWPRRMSSSVLRPVSSVPSVVEYPAWEQAMDHDPGIRGEQGWEGDRDHG